MKALVHTAPEEGVYRDEPAPDPGAAEVVLRVEAVSICGSDLDADHGHDPRRVPPLILGQEVSGRVVTGAGAIGQGRWGQGRRAVVNPLITCGTCTPCLEGRSNLCAARKLIGMNRPGAFAELIAIPERNLIALPEDLDPVDAALSEPARPALHAQTLAGRALTQPIAKGRALVLGGGSIGLLSALLLQARGCRNIALGDTNVLRRATAEKTGVCRVYDPLEAPGPAADAFDLEVDAVGAGATRASALEAVKPGGVVLHIGLFSVAGELDLRKLTLCEITLIGIYTYTPADLKAADATLHSGALGPLDWVEQRPLTDGARAFDDLGKSRLAAAKVVLRPD
jgi:alcohol dehydrogenase